MNGRLRSRSDSRSLHDHTNALLELTILECPKNGGLANRDAKLPPEEQERRAAARKQHCRVLKDEWGVN